MRMESGVSVWPPMFGETVNLRHFLLTAREAAKACKLADQEKAFVSEFENFLDYLRKWCCERATEVDSAFVFPGDGGGLTTLICTPGKEYCLEFDDEITRLDIDLAKQFPRLVTEVLQAPATIREGHAAMEKAIMTSPTKVHASQHQSWRRLKIFPWPDPYAFCIHIP